MKSLLVFIHTKLMDVEGVLQNAILAVPFWQAKYNKVFTSLSEDYAVYTPIRFDKI
jgi:hypothetical protein